MNLEAMVCALQNKNVDHLGIRGEVLKVRLLVSSTYGLKVLNNEEMLEDIIKSWTEHLNQSYVSLVEDLVSDGLTRHQRDDDLSYGRRTFDAHAVRSAFLPFHLYGQLASTKLGLEVLIRHPDIHEMLGHLANAGDNNKNWQLTKKSIWAVANVCASYEGACFVDREGGIESLIKISEESNILSLKATAFYALSLVATTRFGCQVLASKGWCTLKYGRDDPWPVLEDWFIRFQIATIILDQDEPEDVPMDDVDHFKASTRRSSSLQYTPVINDADDTIDDTIHPRSSSLSSRKRLSNIFKSLSDKKDGNKSSSITRRIKRSLFKENSHGDSSSAAAPIVDTIEENDIINSASSVAAPIATPEKSSQSSSTGDTLEEITEENEHKINCTKSESDQSLPMTTSAPFVKPVRMKQRSGQRAYSESEAQSLLTANPISSIVPGASITSMASTGSYTDNPGFLTLRSIHSRHRPVLDFIETGDDHDHGTAQERIKRSDSVSAKKRHSSGSGTTGRKLSTVNNRKKLLGPLKDEDMSKIVNDRYWGITLPAKMDALLSDKIENTLLEEIDISNPPASPGNFEYHSEETCLQCYNYLDINQTSPLGTRHRSSSLTCSTTLDTEDLNKSGSGTKSTIGSPINLRKQVMKTNIAMQELESAKQKAHKRKEALKIISTLNASVGALRTEETLLKMKQQSPQTFKDLCFYSEVCQLMGHFSFRLSSRRFIQELFMDVSFEVLNEDARKLLATQHQRSTIDEDSKNDDDDEPFQE